MSSKIYNNINWDDTREIRLWADKLLYIKWINVGDTNAPLFENGWTNYGTTTTQLGFYIDVWGTVHLRGHIADSGFSSGATVFTLPAGYRPMYVHSIPTISDGGVISYIAVGTDGTVKVYGAAAAGTLTSLDGVNFSTR